MEFNHISVLLNECIEGLNINPNGIYVDGTAGGGGHSAEILKKLDCGKLISIDRDPDAITTISERFKNEPNSIIVNGCFGDMKKLLNDRGIYQVDGVLLDIGVSSHQLDTDERGFSFHKDAPLDMRMSQSGTSAEDLVNDLSYEELRDIIYRYGEDKFAPSIAKGIVKAREEERITTTLQLAEIIKNSVPQKVRREGLDEAFEMLSPKGRLAVISFHSLEDRIVKQKMASWCKGCTCPKDFPVCVCGNVPKAKLVNRKPIEATQEELDKNPRSRSAKLRICEKI